MKWHWARITFRKKVRFCAFQEILGKTTRWCPLECVRVWRYWIVPLWIQEKENKNSIEAEREKKLWIFCARQRRKQTKSTEFNSNFLSHFFFFFVRLRSWIVIKAHKFTQYTIDNLYNQLTSTQTPAPNRRYIFAFESRKKEIKFVRRINRIVFSIGWMSHSIRNTILSNVNSKRMCYVPLLHTHTR